MKFSKKNIIIISVILVIGVIGWSWWSSTQPKAVQVEMVEVENVVVRETISASGSIVSENTANLNFLSGGTISQMNVMKGDIVSRGQILAVLDSRSAAQSAQAAKDARDIALRNKELFVAQYVNKKSLVGGEEQYDIRIRTLDEQISQAEASYRSQVSSLSSLNITAPFAGTVVDVFKKNGEPASPGEVIIVLSDLDQLYFEIDIDQEDFGKVALGDLAEVELDSYPDEIFYGTVEELPTYINPQIGENQLKVKISLDATNDRQILLGMAGDGTIVSEASSDPVQALPFDAIFTENGNSYIWILNNNILEKKYINTGIIGDIYTEVLDDLDGLSIVIPSDPKVEANEGDKGQIVKK